MKKHYMACMKSRAEYPEFTRTQPTVSAGYQLQTTAQIHTMPSTTENEPTPAFNEPSILDPSNLQVKATNIPSRTEIPNESIPGNLSTDLVPTALESKPCNIMTSVTPQIKQALALVRRQNEFTGISIDVVTCLDGLMKSFFEKHNQSTTLQNVLNQSRISQVKEHPVGEDTKVTEEEMPSSLPAEELKIRNKENVAAVVCSKNLRNENADDIATPMPAFSLQHPGTSQSYTAPLTPTDKNINKNETSVIKPVCSGNQRKHIGPDRSKRNGSNSEDLKLNAEEGHCDKSSSKKLSIKSTLENSTSARNCSANIILNNNNAIENNSGKKIIILEDQYISNKHNSNKNHKNVSAEKIMTKSSSFKPNMKDSQGDNGTTEILSRSVKRSNLKEIYGNNDNTNKTEHGNQKNTTKATSKRFITAKEMIDAERDFSKRFRDVIKDIKETFIASNAMIGHIYATNQTTAATFDKFLSMTTDGENCTQNLKGKGNENLDVDKVTKQSSIVEHEAKRKEKKKGKVTEKQKSLRTNDMNNIESPPKRLWIEEQQTIENQNNSCTLIPKRKFSEDKTSNMESPPKKRLINRELEEHKQQTDHEQKKRDPKSHHQNSKIQQSDDKNNTKKSDEELATNRELVEPKKQTNEQSDVNSETCHKSSYSKPKHGEIGVAKIILKRTFESERDSNHGHKRTRGNKCPKYYVDHSSDDSNSDYSHESEATRKSSERLKLTKNENKIILGTKKVPSEDITKSLLRYRCSGTGLVELTDGSEIFVRRKRRSQCLKNSNDCMSLIGLLMREIFTNEALTESKVTAENIAVKGSVLGYWPVIILLDYVIETGRKMGWKDVERVRLP